MLWLVAGLVVAAGIAVGGDRLFFSGGGEASRPDLQRTLDALVSGAQRSAPGASAYVVGPDGSWAGAAGVANVKTAAAMTVDARMRIESNSKIWLLAVMLQLAKEGKLNLDDTVAHWLPGLLPYGDKITLRRLMSDSERLGRRLRRDVQLTERIRARAPERQGSEAASALDGTGDASPNQPGDQDRPDLGDPARRLAAALLCARQPLPPLQRRAGTSRA